MDQLCRGLASSEMLDLSVQRDPDEFNDGYGRATPLTWYSLARGRQRLLQGSSRDCRRQAR